MTYPFIPFCTTKTNEYLVFINLSKEETESVVLDAFHEESPDTWGVVADNFVDFLNEYINSNGNPDVLGDEDQGVATDYTELSEEDEKDGGPQEIIERTSRELKANPEDHWAMIERGTAYIDMENFPAALADINAAIDLKPDDAYYYFIRGDLYQKAGKIRAALIDYDIAVKLKPDDTLYLSCRAGVLWQMKKYGPALADANLAIEINDKDILAYMMRESIYRSLGENEKADMDAEKINDLQEKE
jgi:tetratricopeptide (TPR) repeat protein